MGAAMIVSPPSSLLYTSPQYNAGAFFLAPLFNNSSACGVRITLFGLENMFLLITPPDDSSPYSISIVLFRYIIYIPFFFSFFFFFFLFSFYLIKFFNTKLFWI